MKTDVGDKLLEKLRNEVDDNLTNEQFGVEVLARNVGMSRSQLHRKLTSITGQSVSQFIREYRLQRGMELLKEGELTAAEVADRIGFGSATYFSKCFTEYYGHPPGGVKNRSDEQNETEINREDIVPPSVKVPRFRKAIFMGAGAAVVTLALFLFYFKGGRPHTIYRTGGQVDRSIAVLPFKNLSSDSQNEYFTEGVVEAIRTHLSQIRQLRVISRTSVEQYRAGAKSAKAIGDELGVAVILEGSLQRDHDKVRIEVRLIDARTEGQIWADTYDHELQDVFSIQREIAQQVAYELQAKLSPEEQESLSKTDTRNPVAYDLYLRGVYEYRTYTNAGAHNAIALFSQAIALDPDYARAHAFLANSYFGLATIWGAELTAVEALRKGKPFLDKALTLDPQLSEAHMLMGFYYLYHDWDFIKAESSYAAGIITDHPDGMAMYIDYLNFMSRHDEALELARRLNAKDPYYPNSRLAWSYFYNGKIKEAVEHSEARLRIFNSYSAFDSHGFLMLNSQQYDKAIRYFQKAIALEGIRYPRILGWMGSAYAKSGNADEARRIIVELEERLRKNEGGSIAFFIATIYSALDENQSAMYWLKKAYQNHDMEMPWLKTEPQFYALHGEPEFQQIAKAMGFPTN